MKSALPFFFAVPLAFAACGGSSASTSVAPDAGGGTDSAAACPVANGAPSPRGDLGAAFDATGKTAVVFGGDTGVAPCGGTPAHAHVGDTWLYDTACTTWVPVDGAGPDARSRHALVSDAAHNRAILFGGRTRAGSSGPYTNFNDTWSFDFATRAWTKLATTGPAPSARSNTAAVVDEKGNRLIVFGGNSNTSGLAFTPLDDTFALDLTTLVWSPIATATKPPARLFHAMAIDPASQTVFVASGGDANAFTGPFFQDVWALDLGGSVWSELKANGAPPNGRINFGMTYDASGHRLLVFGGHDDGPMGNNNEIWSFDPGVRSWTRLPIGDKLHTPSAQTCVFAPDFTTIDKSSPERRSSFGFAPKPGGSSFGIFEGKSDCGLLGDALLFDARVPGWSMLSASPVGLSCLRVQASCTGLCG